MASWEARTRAVLLFMGMSLPRLSSARDPIAASGLRWWNLLAGASPARRLPLLLPVLPLLAAVLAPPFNQDAAAVLQWSQRWLAGERLYVDLIDVNPPLIFVLNLIPAMLARWLPLDGITSCQI